jgi:hypothetical protein
VLAGDEAQARSVKYGRSARERLSHTHPVRLINHGGMHAVGRRKGRQLVASVAAFAATERSDMCAAMRVAGTAGRCPILLDVSV